jgi:hypothetical protein
MYESDPAHNDPISILLALLIVATEAPILAAVRRGSSIIARMVPRHVHVEVVELGKGSPFTGQVTGEVRIYTGENRSFTVYATFGSRQAPYWRTLSIEPVGGDEVLETATEIIGLEELYYRIGVAATLWNLWDSAKASSDARRERENDED